MLTSKFFLLGFSGLFSLSANAIHLSDVDVPLTVNEKVGIEEQSDSSRIFDLDEVTIWSQPKDNFKLRLQPVSSSSFSSDDLQMLHSNDLRELSVYTPSFVMPNYGSRITSSVYVRGIGSRVNNPAIGIYIDDMPLLSKSAFNFRFYDIERVDILRGPQGTLYGQNSEGGIVRIYTHNPMNYQGTDIKLGIGTRFYRNVEVSHFNKVTDNLAFSLSAFYDGQNGFFKNRSTGDRADNYNEAGGRFRLVATPISKLTIDYVADYQYVKQNGFPYGIYDEERETTHSPATTFQSNYRRNIFNTALNLKYQANGFDIFSTTSYQYLKDYMSMDQDYLPEDYLSLKQRQHQNSLSQELVFKSNNDSWWHWNAGAFISKTWLKTWAPVGFGDGITAPIANAIQSAMYNAMVSSMAGRMIAQGMPPTAANAAAAAAIEAAGGVTMDVSMNVPGLFHTPQFNFGVFHESSFDITDRLTATLGLRYDLNHVSVNYDTNAAMAMTANVMGTEATYTLTSFLKNYLSDNFEQLLPKFGLSYRLPNDGGNIYATVSKGYRAGGYNIQMFSDVLQTELNSNSQNAMRGDYDVPHTDEDYERIANTISYKPEVSWNYEFGTHLNLFNRTVHFDLSTFYMQVRNQQLTVMAGNYGFGRRMANAGKSYSCGLETSIHGRAFDNKLDWSIGYGYTRAVFKDYEDIQNINGETVTITYKDKKVPYVPAHTISGKADYRYDFTDNSFLRSIVFGVNVIMLGRTYWDEANEYYQNLYACLGAHADVSIGNITLSVWGKNLTNSDFNTFAVSSAASGTKYLFAQQANPIQVGLDVKFHLFDH